MRGGELTGWAKIYEDFNIQQILNAIKDFTQNINEYMPLSKLFFIIIYIFNYKFEYENKDEEVNIYIIYIVKFLISAIIIVMPIILLIMTLVKLDNIIKKNKKYWWAEDKYNYLNTKNIYIKKIYNLFGIKLSQNISLYLACCIAFIIITLIIFVKFKQIIDSNEGTQLKKILYYNGAIFLVIFLIITTFLALNYNKYNRVYEYNKEINNIYIKYLNKDYIKTICNNFIDDDNNITDTCKFKKIPDTDDLNNYLKSLDIESLQIQDLDLDNEDININYNTQIANKFLSALITHQFLLFIYNNQYKEKTNDNKFCRELKLSNILNNKLDNIFYCFKETTQFPFVENIEGQLLKSSAKQYFNANYRVYTTIVDKYLEINNKLANNITNIKKENVDEITITIIIAVLFIIYLIGLFFVFDKQLQSLGE